MAQDSTPGRRNVSSPNPAQRFIRLPSSMLREGMVLAAPIYDIDGTKLLGQGIVVSRVLIDKLIKRGVASVLVDETDLPALYAFRTQGTLRASLPEHVRVRCTHSSEFSREMDAAIASGRLLAMTELGDPFSRRLEKQPAAPYDVGQMNRYVQENTKAIDDLRQLVNCLRSRLVRNLAPLSEITNGSLDRAAKDIDLFTCLAINPYFSDYPFRHILHTATLATAVAINFGLDERSIIDLEIGCLIHDNGMNLLNRSVMDLPRRLDDDEILEVAKHPILVFDLLMEHLDGVPTASRVVAYQMHERCDGSGYPRGHSTEKIHLLSKIAMIADVYVALVSSRPHRSGMLPYFAIAQMLHGVEAGLFDATVMRTFLYTVSLFPLGSYVELNDDMVGRVIRSNGARFDRPVLEMWHRKDRPANAVVVDLTQREDMEIIRPLITPQ